MELFRTEQYYIFVHGEASLWWDRTTGSFTPKTGWDLTYATDPVCLGICYGLIGKVYHHSLFDPRLVIIKECSPVGHLYGKHLVQKISSIAFLKLGPENPDLSLNICTKHNPSYVDAKRAPQEAQKNAGLLKTWGTIKSAGTSIRNTTQQCATLATNQVKATIKRNNNDTKEKEKFEKRIQEELLRIFCDTDSFYFCRTGDITNCLQRLHEKETGARIGGMTFYKGVDNRFFWNKHMLKDLINFDSPLAAPWILPIIQGFVQIEHCKVNTGFDPDSTDSQEVFTVSLISRRSRYRAGTRYKRRGVDEEGNCANYVETEQVLSYKQHNVSFVQVRGSVPVYWSQPGFKYRPPPRLDRSEAESQVAFEKHFTGELTTYGPVCVVNLVDQSGKEKVIWDSYTNHICSFNNPRLTYTTFDFHEYCRGMHFENVSILVDSLADVIKDMGFFWRDSEGSICYQNGVFRVNCIDCLDRTNVVQGDFTRTGERRFAGIMKDGMNSANRYYIVHFVDAYRQYCIDMIHGVDVGDVQVEDFWDCLSKVNRMLGELVPYESPRYTPQIALGVEFDLANALYYGARYYLSHFKDANRQGTIDLMLGKSVSKESFSESRVLEEDHAATAEHIRQLIHDCKKMFLNNPEQALGSWGLIDADPNTGDPNETEMDSILILTREAYFVADYDHQTDRITKYQKVNLDDLVSLECGIPDSALSIFKNSPKDQHYCIRINYKNNNVKGYFHMFRSTNLRFFNNMAVVIKNTEEENESMKAICEAFLVAVDVSGLPSVPYIQGQRIERRRSKTTNTTSSNSIYLDIANIPQITRNVSETQLTALRTAGSKALSNVTEQISRLTRPKAVLGQKAPPSSSSEDEDFEASIYQPTTAAKGAGREGESHIAGVGIVMSNPKDEAHLAQAGDSGALHAMMLGASMATANQPEIRINNQPEAPDSPKATNLDRKLSHSSDDAFANQPEGVAKRSSSAQDIQQLSISQSQSESALKQMRHGLMNSLTSPVASVTKDLVFTPFTKLAKGVQNLGANLDPRKVREVEHDAEELQQRLAEKFQGCQTRLIAL